jgi:hypothetical protein
LPPPINRLLSCLFQHTDKLEHRPLLESHLHTRSVCEIAFRGGFELECEVVGSKCRLVESCRENGV